MRGCFFLGLLIEAYCCAMDNRVNRFGAAPADYTEYRPYQWINVNYLLQPFVKLCCGFIDCMDSFNVLHGIFIECLLHFSCKLGC